MPLLLTSGAHTAAVPLTVTYQTSRTKIVTDSEFFVVTDLDRLFRSCITFSSDQQREDLELLVNEVNTVYPLVLFGKMRDPYYREIKKVLAEYKITPAPLVIDVDQRRDHRFFIPLLARLLGTEELPQLVLKGESLGSFYDVMGLQERGQLTTTLEESGLAIQVQKKKKKGVKERERIENERILGPAAIQEE